MTQAQNTQTPAPQSEKVKTYIDKPNASLYTHDVDVPPVPEDKAAKGEPFSLQCGIQLKATDDFDEWAKDAGIEYAFGFDDDTNVIQLELDSAESAVFYRLRWG